MDTSHSASALVRKLESITKLSDDAKEALLRLPMNVTSVGPGHDIVREGDRPSNCCLIVEGFACRYKITPEGKRQIHAFHIAGDMPDLQSLHLKVMDHSLATLSPSKLAFIAHHDIHELCRAHPGIVSAFWRDTLIDAAVFREWITNIGRRTAYQRIAHLLCEILARLTAIGLVQGGTFDLPVTQAELADATGLSTVHVNRTLQELRAAGLITMRDGSVTVRDWEGLKAAGEFDPNYLHLRQGEAA